MKRKIIWMAILLMFGHLLAEMSGVLSKIFPEVLSGKANLFIKGGYEMEYWWYVKFTMDDLLWVITFFVLTRLALMISYRLALVSLMFMVFHVIDAFMFWYDYKQSHKFYWGLVALIFGIVILLLPLKERRYKSLL